MERERNRPVLSVIAALGLLAGVVLTTGPALASGGGGCGRAVTDSQGTAVAIRAFCFTPTILRVNTGQEVTWDNRDGVPHTLLGANAVWGGFDQLTQGMEVTYRFVRPGVYPYVCTIHPGMVGAVIVGNPAGPGAARTTTTGAGPVTLVVPTPTPQVPAAVPAPSVPVARGAWPVATFAGFGLFFAAAAALAVERRRRAAAS